MRLAWLRTWGPVLAGPVAAAVIWALPAPMGRAGLEPLKDDIGHTQW